MSLKEFLQLSLSINVISVEILVVGLSHCVTTDQV